MKNDESQSAESAGLRRRAEEQLAAASADAAAPSAADAAGHDHDYAYMTPDMGLDMAPDWTPDVTPGIAPKMASADPRLLHELQVHQVELEMQNDDLLRTRHELESALARYTDLYDFAPVGYATLDRNGTIREVNLAGASMLGVERSELVDRRFQLFVCEEHRSAFTALLEEVCDGGVQRSCEIRLRPKANRPMVVQVAARCSAPGRECGLILADVTDRKRAEEEKLEMERRLLYAQKLESIGILAGGVAHDFNNILAGIMGYADLAILRLPESEPARADIEVIKKAVWRAADLTRQMLAYAGKGKVIVEPVNVSQVVEDSKKMLAMSVSKKATLTYNLAKDLPMVLADASQIDQVVLNLAINASEALGEQSGVIAISTDAIPCDRASLTASRGGSDLREGLYVRLEVADTGCGMDREMQGKIFDPFFTTKFTGRGLGLAAVHGIVRGHKGIVRVFSEPGHGTKFQVLLPASDAAAALSTVDSAPAKPWRGAGTVLVVDDEEIVRTLASRMVEHAGFAVLTVDDGEAAVRVYRQHQDEIVCVLLDLTMPKMGGEETFHALRRIRADVRVILSSGFSEETSTEHFSQAGLAGFIQKPYQLDTMIAKLQRAVSSDRRRSVP